MTGAGLVRVASKSQPLKELGNTKKKVEDLMSDNVKLQKEGNTVKVLGELKDVKDFKEFSSAADEQKGHYFVLVLDAAATGKPVTVTGPKGTKTLVDRVWILRVENNQSKFTIAVEGAEPFTLDFSETTLQASEAA